MVYLIGLADVLLARTFYRKRNTEINHVYGTALSLEPCKYNF